MMGFSKKFFLALALGSVSFLVSAEVSQKEALERFIATSNVQGVQKENAVQELLNLFDKIVEGLKVGGERLSKITTAFYDLCSMLGRIDEPRPHHVRELEAKLEEIYVLISNDTDISPTEKVVLENISSFINLFEELLNNENLNLGGAAAKFVDLFFYKPLEFINQFKYGPEIAATTATVVVAGLGSVIVWKVGKKKEATTNIVKPTTSTTSSKDDEIEMQDFADLAPKTDATNPVTPLPAPKPSESVEITPVEAPVETTSTVVTTNPTIDLTVPSSESGVEAQPVDHSNENAEEDSSDYQSLSEETANPIVKPDDSTPVAASSTNVGTPAVETPSESLSVTQVIEVPGELEKPALSRQDAVGNLQPLITEQAAPKVVEEKKEEPVITTRSGRVSKKTSTFVNDQTNGKKKHHRRKR